MRAVVIAVALLASCASVSEPAFACISRPLPGHPFLPPGPPLGQLLDKLIDEAKIADADLARVKALRAEMARLAAAGAIREARDVEREAMSILGYEKKAALTRCGHGDFVWAKRRGAVS
jgi:hypothetical protein